MMPRTRLETRLHVSWPGVFESYARKWVYRNHWRVRDILYTPEDALQECALIFVRCYNRYRYSVDNPAWFMSLYKTALANDFTTMANKSTRRRGLAKPHELEGTEHNHGPLAVAVRQASKELRAVLDMLAEAPIDVMQSVFAEKDRDVTNKRLRGMSGISRANKADVLGELHALLT